MSILTCIRKSWLDVLDYLLPEKRHLFCTAELNQVLCPTIELGPWPLPSGGDSGDGSCCIVQSALESFM